MSTNESIKVTTLRHPGTSMSLLSMVEQAIKTCKAEQAKINASIQFYRDILQTLTPQPKTGSEESDCADDAAADTDTSPGEKEDMELLERALEKALRVRTGTGPSKKDCDRSKQSAYRKEPGTTVVTSKEGMQASAASKGNQTTTRSTSKSASLDRKEHKKPAGIVHQHAARKSQQGVSASGPLDQEESGACSLPRQNERASDQTAKWKSLRNKQNRLWDKVVALHRKPVPGRSHFMERLRATFPKDWPCGSPDQTRALVDRLTHQGHDLAQHYQTKELLARQTPEAAKQLGGKENKYDSCLTLERLQIAVAELHNFADQVKQEWEAWDRWRPEGGCLCPTGTNVVWGDGMIAPLPLTITYTTEAELRELEKLRMRVALLQQEIYLEQALLDTLSPQLSSIVPGTGCPNISVLRDLYSLLGEGGERFPAIVLDSETD
ncbi:tubulin epsilon and delta complex protein 2 isoform X3 [Siniperca chuatsi]|uniref:tubulin epsilon and delta complex protein 2 isoform X3 n=1 Tax=Siniperca chuatsi TaxID=119488 RepID=UPI001CE1AF12|nr:tubulin epsilon and delta complex protein 2 isoform X3 [Siniperca chuatsi]